MTNPRRPLRINVGFLIKSPIGTRRDFNFAFEKVRLGDDLVLTEFTGGIILDRTQQGLLMQGEFAGSVDQECVRCLEPFVHTLNWTFSEMYAFDKRNMTESGLLVPEDDQIDLEPLLREYALLEFPIQPICKPECNGLCTECGENLNRVDCGHRQQPDSPFAEFKDLLGN